MSSLTAYGIKDVFDTLIDEVVGKTSDADAGNMQNFFGADEQRDDKSAGGASDDDEENDKNNSSKTPTFLGGFQGVGAANNEGLFRLGLIAGASKSIKP